MEGYSLKQIGYAILSRILAPIAALPFSDRHCVICRHRVGRFLPYEGGSWTTPRLMVELDCIGSDVDNFACPWCRSHDGERHLFLYMQRTGMLDDIEGKVVVHFAPERRLSGIIADARPASHIMCDLFPNGPDVRREDLLDMSFQSGSVDLFIANHVMEHVDDDRRAVAEILRVLKVGGRAILQTPFSSILNRTWEDEGIVSEGARLQAYGQADHVRLYGRDIVDRFASLGLTPLVQSHDDVLADINPRTAGVNRREPFLLFERRT